MTLFLTASSFYSIFTQVPKTFNSTVAFQVGFLKHLGDVAAVLLDFVGLSLFCFFMSFQTDWKMRSDLCGALAVIRLLVQTKISLDYYNYVWKCKLIFPTDKQQKIEIIGLKPFLAGENTSVLIVLATTVHFHTIFTQICILSLFLLSVYCCFPCSSEALLSQKFTQM